MWSGFFSSCSKSGLLPCCGAWVLLAAVGSPGAEHGLQGAQASAVVRGLSSCGTQASLLHGMWNFLGQGSNPCLLHWQADSLLLSHQGSPPLLLSLMISIVCNYSTGYLAFSTALLNCHENNILLPNFLMSKDLDWWK